MVWDLSAALAGGVSGVPLLALLACCVAAAPGSAAAAAEPLALKRVVLSSGGVGYFEHEATVEGDAAGLTLPVRLDQVADVLKSIVVDDGAGGGRGTVSLPGREPLAQVFRDLPFGADALESLVGLLRALRGAEVRVTGARAIEGRLLGVTPEEVRLPDGQGTTTRHRVGVMTGSGAQQFILEEAASVEFVDPELQGQVEAGLAALATHRARDRRVLRIAVEGGRGRRAVRVAYVVAVPLWKSSYRLTLPAEGADGTGARLQGWAVIENMTGQDWDGVELTFLSGNPVTFRQDLYSAYYVDRPEVPVEVLGRVLPPADVGTVAGAGGLGQAGEPRPKAARAGAPAELGFESRAAMAPAPPMAMPESYAAMADAAAELAPPGVALAAEAEEAATQVAFRFPEPVGVATGHSLMLPIIDRDVPAERLALYQPETHASHPLATVRLTNDGDTGLPPGVLTLYERGAPDGGGGGAITYVGDARLGALPAGEERLVSFALDQKTRVDREDRGEERIARGRISRGVLELTVLDEQTTVYRLRAPAREDRLVVIEHPRRPGWDLAEPAAEGVELTPGDYRIRHALAAGAEERVSVVTRRPRVERIELIHLGVEDLAVYASTGQLDEPLRRAFARMGELRAEIDRRQRRLDELEGRRAGIVAEQERIRDNLERVPAEGDLHRRYLTTLNAQEDQLERLAADADAAREELNRARDALTSYVAGLDL